jgi:hypothetical protein
MTTDLPPPMLMNQSYQMHPLLMILVCDMHAHQPPIPRLNPLCDGGRFTLSLYLLIVAVFTNGQIFGGATSFARVKHVISFTVH